MAYHFFDLESTSRLMYLMKIKQKKYYFAIAINI